MPTISVPSTICEDIKQPPMDFKNLSDLLFSFGLEIEQCTAEPNVFKVEVPANRTDLMSYEGILAALKCYSGVSNPPSYTIRPTNGEYDIFVERSTGTIRPYCFAGIIRNVHFTEENLARFIDLQDKLHQNIGRRRKLVAIGTHDLDTIKGPFKYSCESPDEIKFKALNQTEEMTGRQLIEMYKSHAQLKAYVPLVECHEKYPVIRDTKGEILSMPPIINSDLTKISTKTKNVFVEVTAESETRGQIVVDTVLSTFSKYSSEYFTVEQVKVVYDGLHRKKPGITKPCPTFENRDVEIKVGDVNAMISADAKLTSAQIVDLLSRMMVRSAARGMDVVVAHVPFYRSDILHACDIIEDVVIAYGYTKIPFTRYPKSTIISRRKLTEGVRMMLAVVGFNESINFGLCSFKESFDFLCRSIDTNELDDTEHLISLCPQTAPVELLNPKTQEFQIVRPSLVPGLLRSLFHNKSKRQPICMFEVGDVCNKSKHPTGTSNKLHLAAIHASSDTSGLAEIHGVLDVLLSRMGGHAVYAETQKPNALFHYRLEHLQAGGGESHPYLDGRCCKIIIEKLKDVTGETCVGEMGTLHPKVLKSFGLTMPVSLFEINLNFALVNFSVEELV